MKLLLDQNLAPRLVGSLAEAFPGSRHVGELGLARASDADVWAYARDNGFTIASERWARERGCTEFASDTLTENESSVRAHLACGFEDVGTVRCFRKTLSPTGRVPDAR